MSEGDTGLAIGSATIPPEHAIVGLLGARAYGRQSVSSADVLAGRLGLEATGPDSYAVERERGRGVFVFDPPPPERGLVGAGTIHHIAWACDEGLPAWRQRVIGMGCTATPVIDRGHCRSIYFREPSGVLFEIATRGQDIAEARTRPGGRGPSAVPSGRPPRSRRLRRLTCAETGEGLIA